ncbi:Outer membrane protein A precursor [Arcticibacter svalbardensis MN12-7]|uniref:Outer membrane protein A n=1 Tax=Arcticibacter svalbardensis MN12-7 TaxID=1150600 RepID=R9GZ63_9SPHI|nr:OmpA family protein [Arcticibacter svalbardensis]EOR94254.1 Outer membrane protein A precursor [Arcticibacter svalbardensis MN12-7]
MKTTLLSIMAAFFLFVFVRAGKDVNTLKKTNAIVLADLTKNLEYDFDKPSVRVSYYKKLDQLASAVIHDNYVVSLRGHADSIGAYKYNWVLSDKRAGNVKEYLVSKGVKSERIITTPFGSTVPIASNKTKAGRQKNRRVEVELKKMGK